MDTLTWFVDIFLHLDKHLAEVTQSFGVWSYVILFVIVFCETGLVVTPILPGDSLLFAAGAIAATGGLDLKVMIFLLLLAAILGDAANYTFGKFFGPKVLRENSRIFRREYLDKTNRFYQKYGGKTIIIARFVPIVRTFAPFLAGVGTMSYPRFALYNVAGAILWVFSLTLAGYYFGEIPFVKSNFSLVVIAIIIISVLPALVEIIKARSAAPESPSV